MIGKKEIPEWKINEVNDLTGLLQQYKTVAVIEVIRMSDRQIQQIRKLLRAKAIIKMSKKNLQLRALEQYKKQSNKENLEYLEKNISGQSALCFTNLHVFELKKIFNDNAWMIPAKPNEITPVDIVVPAGDTGLPTGQVISELNMTLRLPTRIQNDTIWIREDTTTHKTGDFVNVKQAAVLKKLGINPIKSLIRITYAWSDGEAFPAEIIYMDMETFQKDVASAYFSAKHLAIEMGIVDVETIESLIQKAHKEALALAFELPLYIEEMRDEYIKKAVSNAQFINNMIYQAEIQIGTLKKENEKKREEKKKDGEDKKEESVGIGGLFG